ncbi:hypothetical protein [Sedimentitalea nanhaiensis]|uniref:YozE SAM-like domain-containing protein n=1 Tax=Sedimentitalea nanhaiensis TaxID=999627 RepID=A0A1I6YIV6_9RHOB|nr:hypothetical protein [Sedimentitalea nanhaiensis]SFT50449.1 hypothetical protein SAMN05216236_102241 [Sedimentitalea nanhaiensis]
MTWKNTTDDLAAWFTRLQSRFPYLDDSAMPHATRGRARFEAYLAQTHNLSLTEAHEEVDDFLYIESLIREADDSTEAA